MQLFLNNWSAVLAEPATSSALQLVVDPVAAAELTGLGGDAFYLLTLAKIEAGKETDWEIVKCTSVSDGVLTVSRGQEGTTPNTWDLGSSISLRVTAGLMASLSAPVTPDPGGGAEFGPPRTPVGALMSIHRYAGDPELIVMLSAGVMYLSPFEVSAPLTIDALGAESYGGSGSLYRLALYGSDEGGWPDARISETYSSVSADSNAPCVAYCPSTNLLPGQVYWLALKTNVNDKEIPANDSAPLLGYHPDGQRSSCITRNSAWSEAFPAEWDFDLSDLGLSIATPRMLVRRSA